MISINDALEKLHGRLEIVEGAVEDLKALSTQLLAAVDDMNAQVSAIRRESIESARSSRDEGLQTPASSTGRRKKRETATQCTSLSKKLDSVNDV
jgi:hypothetical protein